MIILSKKLAKGLPNHPIVYCPGCKDIHIFDSRWTWNGDAELPTFNPSFLSQAPNHAIKEKRGCHSFLRNGIWEFLKDSTHELAGQEVPLPDLPSWILDNN